MSTKVPDNQVENEVDLAQIFKSVGNGFQKTNSFLFRCIHFFVKNRITLIILFIVGFGIGVFMDITYKTFEHEIIVSPNFESADYLYSKIDLIKSKIKDNDTIFLKNSVGIPFPKELKTIEIKPITDVYQFVTNKPDNFELLKLMAEDGDLKKIVEENITSKNYNFHTISFITSELINQEKFVKPLLTYLNNSEYYNNLKKESVNNLKIKIAQNDTIISQINSVLNGFSSTTNSNQKSNNLVYYNENTQLNDIIKTKENLIAEQGLNKIKLIHSDKIIKDSSIILNKKNSKSVNGKLKLVLPILFIFLFISGRLFLSFYRIQYQKNNLK